MLVLLGPPFEGRNDQYAELAGLSGLVVYDLKTKLKPDTWGVVKALAEVEQARMLHQRLAAAGYRVALVDPGVAHEPERKIVTLRSLALEEAGLGLQLQARSMTIPWGAVLVLVQGQVSVGGDSARSRSSSSSLRAINPSAAELESFRESLNPGQIDAYLALDIHFITVPWVARVDARSFDFGGFPGTSTLQKLESCAAALVDWAQVRLDHGARTSSVNAFTDHSSRARVMTPPPSYASPASRRIGEEPTPRFDAYSRLVAEAERQTRPATVG
ncbi:MAG: hypothetical protein AB7K71_21415 [Polyangiaceae bacterium]